MSPLATAALGPNFTAELEKQFFPRPAKPTWPEDLAHACAAIMEHMLALREQRLNDNNSASSTPWERNE